MIENTRNRTWVTYIVSSVCLLTLLHIYQYTDVQIADRCYIGPPSIMGNVTSAVVGLVYNINPQPEYEFPSSTRFGQFQNFAKIELRHCPPQTLLRKKILHGVWVLFHSYLRVRFNLPSSIDFRDTVSGCHKLGAQNPYRITLCPRWYH